MTRDEADSSSATRRGAVARALAEKMGWTIQDEDGSPMFFDADLNGIAYLPAPDAPLHEKLAFVGRLAEALGTITPYMNFRIDWNRCTSPDLRAVVTFNYDFEATAGDLVLAALFAAAEAAKGGEVPMTNEDRDQDCGSNLDRAREIVGKCQDASLRDESMLVSEVAAALDAAEERGAEAMRAEVLDLSDELPDWTLGSAENMRALEGRIRALSAAQVCAARRAGTK